MLRRIGMAQQLVSNVVLYRQWIALKGIAPTAAAGRLQQHFVTGIDAQQIDLTERRAAVCIRIERQRGRLTGLAALHSGLGWTLLGLVALHVAGVAFTSWQHRENLVAAMFTGRKAPPAEPGDH